MTNINCKVPNKKIELFFKLRLYLFNKVPYLINSMNLTVRILVIKVH